MCLHVISHITRLYKRASRDLVKDKKSDLIATAGVE